MMKFCPNCGAKVVIENAKFCMECGTSFTDFTNKESEPAMEKPQNDFFAEAVESSEPENDGGFFSDMGEAAKEEEDANQGAIKEATKYFIRGDVRSAERILSDIKCKNRRVNHILAMIYEIGGEGVDKDQDKVLKILENEDMSGIICVNIFNEFFDNKDESDSKYNEMIQKMVYELPKAENECQGPFDECSLGAFYLLDTRFQDIGKAKMYLERASSHDMWPAQYVLGIAYGAGVFGKVDHNKSYQYYEKAAKKGFALAARELGTMLYWGNGCNVNHREARKWYLVGAKQNEPLCVYQVGVICEEEGNYHEAIKWLEKAISLPNSPYLENACAELGVLLVNGNDNPAIPTNHIRGYQLIQKALSINPKNGQALLGLAMTYACEDIPEMANVEPEQRLEMFKRYCNEAVRYSDGAIREEAQTALAHIEKLERESANQQNSEGCFITTAVCDSFGKADDCYELMMFRDFRDTWLARQVDGDTLIKEYYRIAPRIVDNINRTSNPQDIYRHIWEMHLLPCLQDIEERSFESCKERYICMVEKLKEKFL